MSYSTDGYSTDENKRKRQDEEESPFKKSKKTSRTPTKATRLKEMEELKEIMSQVMNEIKEMRKENSEYKKELKMLRQENEEMKTEIRLIKERIKGLEMAEWRLEKEERKGRKNNIVISGLRLKNIEDNLLKTSIVEFLKLHLNLQPKILFAKKINEKLCMATIETFDQKMQIMKNKHRLDKLKDRKVFISDDLTYKEREIQRKIRERERQKKERRD